jgi:hypothetical protein
MKCVKCGYISFDYNQACPKCNKDLSAERERLNLSRFKPEPPSLLAALIGGAGESQESMQDTGTYPGEEARGSGLSFDDSGTFDSGGVSFDDADDFDNGEISLDDSQELELDFETHASDEFELSDGASTIHEEESVADFDFGAATGTSEFSYDISEPGASEADELALDLDGFSVEEPASDGAVSLETDSTEDEAFDFGDLSLDDEPASDGTLSLETDSAGDEALGFGDISFDEADSSGGMGEVEDNNVRGEPDIDFEDLSLESDDTPGKDLELYLDDMAADGPEPEEDLGDVDLMASSELALDLNGTPLEGAPFSEADFSEDDVATIDLDDLDLELEMEEREQQKTI